MTTVDQEMEKATSARLRDEDIEAARATVGIYRPGKLREYVRRVSTDAIRNFALGLGDDNPLYVDEDYGRATRWGGQVAPPSMVGIVNDRMYGDKPAQKVRRPSFRGIHLFVSGGRWDWYRPLRPGDTLYQINGVESVEEKESSFAERSLIHTWHNVKVNQRAEVVAEQRIVGIYAERRTARERGKYADIEAASYTDEQIAEIDAVYAAEGPRGATPRHWEDVQVGDELPRMAKGPLTVTEVMVFHAGGYGFSPYAPAASRVGYKNRQRIPAFYVKNDQGIPDVAQRVHWDSAWAQAIGNPMAYDYGVMRQCWLTHHLSDWIGDDGWIVHQEEQIRKFNFMGDTQILTGEVVGKRQDGPRFLVDVELRCTNQDGVVTAPAQATVALPSRDHGCVLLPKPPEHLEKMAAELMARHNALAVERSRAGADGS